MLVNLLSIFLEIMNLAYFANLTCCYDLNSYSKFCYITYADLKNLYFSELREKYELELENLTLTAQPFKTLKFFTLAVIQCIKKTTLYLLAKGGWVMLFSVAVGTFGIVLMTLGGLQEKVFLFSLYNILIVLEQRTLRL